VFDLDAVPPLTLRQKHTIEVVIDRFRPRDDIKQRLAESFETALRLGDGLVIVVNMDDAKASEQMLSSRYSCPLCDYSLPELEPRLFSFNSPVGACPSCDGLGVTQVFDPARVVGHPELSLSGGAVRGWDRRNAHYFQLILSLAETSRERPEGRAVWQRQGQDCVSLHHRTWRQGHPRASVRGHPAEPGSALQGNRIARGTRGTGEVHQRPALPHLRRTATESFGSQCVRG
jgi:hypothetical protein